MSHDNSYRNEELLAELILNYEEALNDSTSTNHTDWTAAELSPDYVQEWKDVKNTLDFLKKLHVRGELPQISLRRLAAESYGPAIPRRVGRFTLKRELGRGGLGIVYLAYDPLLRREVALKLPRLESLLDPSIRQRFLREAEASARLSHPQIVTLLEVGEDGPICYLASEYCPGPTLAEWLRARSEPVAVKLAAQITLSLAEATEHAHSRGVLHRDIKPSNVLLSAATNHEMPDIGLQPKLADFGMAKLLEQDDDARTRTGAIIGTVAYMAPEQIEGRVRDLDVRTDVYALGAVLYELVTGAPPYKGQNDLDVLRRVIAEEVTPPRKLRPIIPRDLEAIVLKCLAKCPGARYATAHELTEDLKRFLEGLPTVARPLGVYGRSLKWIKRRPATLAIALLSAISVSTLLLFNSWRIDSQAKAARFEEMAGEERYRASTEETRSHRVVYASQMRRAQQAWRDGDLNLLRLILNDYGDNSPEAGLRHFEWYYLNYLAHLPHREFKISNGDAYGVAYAPDGKTIVTGGQDGTVQLWDSKSGRILATWQEHTGSVNCVDFSSDGDTFATASGDKTIKLWSLSARKVLATLTGHSTEVDLCLFIDGGNRLISLSHDLAGTRGLREIRVWDVATKTARTDWPPAGTLFNSLCVGRSGNVLVTSFNGQVIVWKRDGDGWMADHNLNYISPAIGAISTDDEFALVPSDPRSLQVVRIRDGGIVNEFDGHVGGISGLSLSPAGDRVATASGDGAIRVFNYPSGELEHCLLGHTAGVWEVAWAPDGRSLASVGRDGTLRIWNLGSGTEYARLSVPEAHHLNHYTSARHVAFLQDGLHAATAFNDATLIWDLRTAQLISGGESSTTQLDASSSIKPLFGDYAGDRIPKLDPAACFIPLTTSPNPFDSPSGEANCIQMLSDKRRLAQIRGGMYRIWSWDPLQMLSETQLPESSAPYVLAISPSGSQCCAAQPNRIVEVRTIDGKTKVTLGPILAANEAVFSPDGLRVLIRANGALEFDTRTGKQLRNYARGRTQACNYSNDGQRVAVSSDLGYTSIFDCITGEETLRLDAGSSAIVFSSDGTSLLTGDGESGGLRYWPGRN